MKKTIRCTASLLILFFTVTAFAGEIVSRPASGGGDGSPSVKFHYMGYLARITDEGIVLAGKKLLFSPKVEFYSGTGKRISRYDFDKGQKAGCLLGKDGRVVQLREILPD